MFLPEEGTEENMYILERKIMQRRAALFFVLIFSILTAVFAVIRTQEVLAVDVSDYYKERLKFDEEGNLLMTTHDRKATSKVTYRTLGWIIKRYDMPIDAPGQQYAVIVLRKYSDIEYKDDPEDSGYVYCYYYGDKKDIIGSIKKVDKVWFNQLNNYGDYVYIDEVMTVCEDGVVKGSLSSSGKASGEVYFTYDGIAGARPWASKESIKTHFDKTVKFPALVHTKKYYKSVTKNNIDNLQSIPEGTLHFGHGTKDNSVFDVGKGVPAGEMLYLDGKVTTCIYNIGVNRVDVDIDIPVRIVTTYHLKWTDYYGKQRKEDKKVARWYLVKRKASYWKIEGFDAKRLIGVNIYNKAIEGENVVIEYGHAPEVKYIDKASYEVPQKLVEKDIDGGDLYGTKGIKPAIPDEDQSKKAEAFVGNIKTTNDYLKINGSVIVDNSKGFRRESVEKLFRDNERAVYKENIHIHRLTKNHEAYNSDATSVYIGDDGETYEYNVSVNDISVLTPVACGGSVSDDKAHNQCISPDKTRNSLTIGRTFYVGISTQGTHNDWEGYGTADYSEYAWKTQIRIPFDVFRAGRRVKGGTWMDVENGTVPVAIPVGTKEGKYTIRYRVVALNAVNVEDYEKLTCEKANTKYSSYVATDKIEVNVVGRIHNLILDNDYKVGIRDCDGIKRGCVNSVPYIMEEAGQIPISVTTDGDYNTSKDSVVINMSYYYMDEHGKRKSLKAFVRQTDDNGDVKLDNMQNTVVLNHKMRIFTGDTMKYKVDDDKKAKEGRQVWNGNIDIPDNVIFVPYEADIKEGIYDAATVNEKAVNVSVIINFDIMALKNGKSCISYINAGNSKAGYANMWKIEEGVNSINMDGSEVALEYGDSIIYRCNNAKSVTYMVRGTH